MIDAFVFVMFPASTSCELFHHVHSSRVYIKTQMCFYCENASVRFRCVYCILFVFSVWGRVSDLSNRWRSFLPQPSLQVSLETTAAAEDEEFHFLRRLFF